MELGLVAEQFHVDVAYHNFGHILNALVYAEQEITRYQAHETKLLPVGSIYKAILLHDIDVHRPLDARFQSKEHRSAAIAGYLLRESNEDEETIKNIKKWIINTNPDFPCQDDAGKIVCRSDLGNIADSLPIFVAEFVKVYRETQQLKWRNGHHLDIVNPVVAARESTEYLKKYFRQDLTLGTGDWDKKSGVCTFVAKALANFVELPAEVSQLPAEVFELEA